MSFFRNGRKIQKLQFLTELMKKTIIILVLMLSLGCIGQKKTHTEADSLRIAREFVLDSPTYKYDGETLKHTETITLKPQFCWQFTFEFTSRHAGYGDRSGQMVAQMITHHTAKITVEQGKVTHAILDDTWDMLNQEMIE